MPADTSDQATTRSRSLELNHSSGTLPLGTALR
jgi:hypothetical protein